jgi:hypothetical protein
MNTSYGDYSLWMAQQHVDESARKAERRRMVVEARVEKRAIEHHRTSRSNVSVRWVRGLLAAALHILPA